MFIQKVKKCIILSKRLGSEYISFLEQNKTFKCSEISVNKITKRVEYVKYEEI